MNITKKWIGVDLDSTLAKATPSTIETVIGPPVPLMVARVKQWLREGKDVRIFTARITHCTDKEAVIHAIQSWCILHLGRQLRVTCKKDGDMDEIWDDRARQVEPDTGKLVYNPEWVEEFNLEAARNKEPIL